MTSLFLPFRHIPGQVDLTKQAECKCDNCKLILLFIFIFISDFNLRILGQHLGQFGTSLWTGSTFYYLSCFLVVGCSLVNFTWLARYICKKNSEFLYLCKVTFHNIQCYVFNCYCCLTVALSLPLPTVTLPVPYLNVALQLTSPYR